MRKFVLTSAAAFAMLSLTAQDDSTAKPMDEVVMVAQRQKGARAQTPYSVDVLNQKTLQQLQPRTTPEALMGVSGVFVQKTNHGGGSPFLRGLTGNQVLVLVDGIRLNNSTFRYGPNQYLNTIDAYSINRIEVAKGTGSVQYGSDALGGVIQVLTNDPQFSETKNLGGRITGKYMTGGMEKTVRGDALYGSKNFALNAGLARRSFGDLIGGDTTGRQSPSGYEEWSYDLKAKWLLGKGAVLTAANQFLRQSHVPVYHKLRLENFAVNEMDPQQRMLTYARLGLKSPKPLFSETELTLSLQNTTEGRASRKNGSNVLRREEDKVQTMGFTIDNLSRFSKQWTANSGVELYADKVGSTRSDVNRQTNESKSLRGLYPNDSRYGNYSVYSLHHFTGKKLTIDAGLRYNIFSVRIQDTSLGKVRINPSALVANAAVLYSLHPLHNVYLSYSSGYRAPNVDDMGTLGVVDFRYEVPTASLKPESSQNFEAGYKLSSKKLQLTLAAYRLRINRLIARIKQEGQTVNGYPVYRKKNVEDAFVKGFEATAQFHPAKEISLLANLAYAYGQNQTRNEPLRRIPPLNGRVLATWQKGRSSFGAETLFASKQDRLAQGDKDDNRIPAGGTPGFNVMNLYAGYAFGKARLNAGAQNLFDEDYRTHGSGINGVGRSAWLALTLNF